MDKFNQENIVPIPFSKILMVFVFSVTIDVSNFLLNLPLTHAITFIFNIS